MIEIVPCEDVFWVTVPSGGENATIECRYAHYRDALAAAHLLAHRYGIAVAPQPAALSGKGGAQ
jgi:hypothetical protein